jgi:hypothetical protein
VVRLVHVDRERDDVAVRLKDIECLDSRIAGSTNDAAAKPSSASAVSGSIGSRVHPSVLPHPG